MSLRCVWMLVLFPFCVEIVLAQPRESQHHVAIWGMGGGSAFFEDAGQIRSGICGTGGLGVGYEWARKHFILQTGLDFSCLRGNLQMDDFVHEVPMVDTEGQEYTGRYYFNENEDVYSLGYLQIPILAGARFGKFYFLAGGKIGVNLYGTSNVENLVKSTGQYDEFIGEFENMPNHGFETCEAKADYSVKTGLNCAASLEMGWQLLESEKKFPWMCRLGIVCDYGILDIHTDSYSEPLIKEVSGMPYYWPAMNSLVRSDFFSGKSLRPLFVGVKFTVLFALPKKYDCHCDWN